MALVTKSDNNKRLVRGKPPLKLKDYLCREDLSSCSSNGFKSFPRWTCCTSVRFLLEIDLKKQSSSSSSSRPTPPLKRQRSKSVLQKASQAILNAVKLLPFPSGNPQTNAVHKGGHGRGTLYLLPRTLSKKLAKRGFWWKKNRGESNKSREIERWRLFHQFLEQKDDEPSDEETTDTSKTTAISTGRVSTSTSSDSNSHGKSWAGSEFTSNNLPSSSSSNSETSSENELGEVKNGLPQQEQQVSDGVGVGVPVGDGDDDEFVGNASKLNETSSDEGKEQLSPVSVLDCPLNDENDDDSSPFQHHLINGTKHKFIQKLWRTDGLSQLQPLDLGKRLAPSHDLEEQSESITGSFSDVPERFKLFFRARNPSNSFKLKGLEKLLLDFVSDISDEANGQDLLSEAEDWVNGQPKNLILGWEVRQGRERYLKEMERNGRWADLGREREDLGAQLEEEIFSVLIDELVNDFFKLS